MPSRSKSNGISPIIATNGNGHSTYQPISSVWEGSDGDLLEAMFKFYSTEFSLNRSWMRHATRVGSGRVLYRGLFRWILTRSTNRQSSETIAK